MKPKHGSKSPFTPNIRVFRRRWPLVIQNGTVDADSIIQSAHYLSGLFKQFEREEKVAVQANIEITVILHED